MTGVLCVNAGSSSLKCAQFGFDGGAERALARASVERIGLDAGRLVARDARGEVAGEREDRFADHGAALHAALDALADLGLGPPEAVGHRVVHGGPDHTAPAVVDDALLDALRTLVAFAPLHQPAALAGIDAARTRFPGIVQVACFDTAFHERMPAVARRLPLPSVFWDKGVRRYGFHGLSYEYVVDALGASMLGRAVLAHLGNGASLAAVRDGEPVDTTMSFTPTGGVMMGTRSGDIDPGALVYLLRTEARDADALEHLVDRESGLLGVSRSSPDMETLLAQRAREPDAALAVEMFCYAVRKQVGAFTAALGGLDTLVFTGGIGEHAAPVREEICRGLSHLGVHVDARRNARNAEVVSPDEAPCTVRVLATDEEAVIARHTRALALSPLRP